LIANNLWSPEIEDTRTGTIPRRAVGPAKDPQPHKAAARLFAAMAYPLSEPRRQTFERAICNKSIRAAAADPVWRSSVQMIRPEHALMNAEID
jgi:hypothetical protein